MIDLSMSCLRPTFIDSTANSYACLYCIASVCLNTCALILIALYSGLVTATNTLFYCRAIASSAVCVCVRLSGTFVHSVKTNKHIFKFFSPSDNHTILFLPYQTAWQYSYENPPPTGTSSAEITILSLYMASLRAVNAATCQVLSIRRCRITVPQVVSFIAGSKRRSLLMAEDDDEMFMTRSLNVTPKTTEQRIEANY